MKEHFYITISKDRMVAEINCTEAYKRRNISAAEKDVYVLLHEKKITFGIDKASVKSLVNQLPSSSFPLPIAKGIRPENGIDGSIHYELDFSTEIDRTLDTDFRDVMRIPMVKEHQKLATIIPPTNGENGTNVFGQSVQARRGKPVILRAGKNVTYKEEDRSFYSVEEGQPGTRGKYIDVHSVFELNDTLSMKTGNIDFVGSVTINGDVPTGYTVKAAGDIKIFGIVEAATIIAGGSVFVSEGLAGLQKGSLSAKEDVHIGYINQGIVNAGKCLYVENSIIHSTCVVKEHVYCQKGNIVGGSLSAGKSIEAKDIGNRLNTKTTIAFNIDTLADGKVSQLKRRQKKVENTLKQLALIGKKLQDSVDKQDVKIKLTLLRQKNSYEKTSKKLTKITDELRQLHTDRDDETEVKIIVRNYIYPNVIVSFGKYKREIKQAYHYAQVKLTRNEISVSALK